MNTAHQPVSQTAPQPGKPESHLARMYDALDAIHSRVECLANTLSVTSSRVFGAAPGNEEAKDGQPIEGQLQSLSVKIEAINVELTRASQEADRLATL